MVEIGVPIENQGLNEVEIAFKPRVFARGFQIVSLGYGNGCCCEIRGVRAIRECRRQAPRLVSERQLKVELPSISRPGRARTGLQRVSRSRHAKRHNTWTVGIELNGENHELALTPQLRKGLTAPPGALAASIGAMVQ